MSKTREPAVILKDVRKSFGDIHAARAKFNNFVYDLFMMIHKLNIKNTKLCELRDMTLSKLISGEIDISDIDIAV